MMTKFTAAAALALLTACGSASVAEQEAAAQIRTAAAPLTIAGIRIGMAAPEVQATLARTGWKVEASAGEDWAATVDHEAKRQRDVFPIEEPKNPKHLSQVIDWLGWDKILFSTDYPHWDYDDPQYAFKIPLTPEQRQMVFRDNARRVYRQLAA